MTSTRFLAALVGLAILLPAIVLGGPVAVEIIVVLAGIVALSEYAAMAFPEDRWFMTGATMLLWGVVYGSALYLPVELGPAVLGVTAVGVLMLQTFRPGEALEGSADNAGRLWLGVAWIGLLAFLPLLRRQEDGLALLFLVLVISWLGDTGAYFAGRLFGRTKLYERISPNKTWEGAIGGVVLATVGTFVVREVGLPSLSVVDCLLLGPTLCLAGVAGDLAESMLKRSYQVKDSGWILPGHGGLLDRVDSLLFVAPLLYAWVRLVEA